MAVPWVCFQLSRSISSSAANPFGNASGHVTSTTSRDPQARSFSPRGAHSCETCCCGPRGSPRKTAVRASNTPPCETAAERRIPVLALPARAPKSTSAPRPSWRCAASPNDHRWSASPRVRRRPARDCRQPAGDRCGCSSAPRAAVKCGASDPAEVSRARTGEPPPPAGSYDAGRRHGSGRRVATVSVRAPSSIQRKRRAHAPTGRTARSTRVRVRAGCRGRRSRSRVRKCRWRSSGRPFRFPIRSGRPSRVPTGNSGFRLT